MRSKEEILNEIADIKIRIDEYSNDITYIEDSISYLIDMQDQMATTVLGRINAYDMTLGEEWRGKLEQEAEDCRKLVCEGICYGQSETAEAINNLRFVSRRISNLADESVKRISMLESELEIWG